MWFYLSFKLSTVATNLESCLYLLINRSSVRACGCVHACECVICFHFQTAGQIRLKFGMLFPSTPVEHYQTHVGVALS